MGNAARKAVMNCKLPVRKQAPRGPAESVAQRGAPSIASGKGAESCAVPCATSPSTGSLRPESATWSVNLQDWPARRRHLDRDHNRPLSPGWDGNLWQIFGPNSNRQTFRHIDRLEVRNRPAVADAKSRSSQFFLQNEPNLILRPWSIPSIEHESLSQFTRESRDHLPGVVTGACERHTLAKRSRIPRSYSRAAIRFSIGLEHQDNVLVT